MIFPDRPTKTASKHAAPDHSRSSRAALMETQSADERIY